MVLAADAVEMLTHSIMSESCGGYFYSGAKEAGGKEANTSLSGSISVGIMMTPTPLAVLCLLVGAQMDRVLVSHS